MANVTKITNFITQEVDDNGNVISTRADVKVENKTERFQEIVSAIAHPSGSNAEVTILETEDGPTEEAIQQETQNNKRPGPINISKILRGGEDGRGSAVSIKY